MKNPTIEINNYDDVISYLGEAECKEPDFGSFAEEDREYELNSFRLKKGIKALNKLANGGEEWRPDFNDRDQEKHFPVFINGEDTGRGSAFAFQLSFTTYDYAYSSVGSRFVFIDEETSDKAAEIFFDMYKIYNLR